MNRSIFALLCACVGLTVASVSTPVSAATLTVPGNANIFGAGKTIPPAPANGGGGVLPSGYSFSAGIGKVLTFSSVTGLVSCCGPEAFSGPDGGLFASGTTDILSFEGISGIKNDDATLFLIGVFLSDAAPADPAPSRLDFTGNTDFTELSPVLGQTFFIGDGLTGTGTGIVQKFNVPTEATRLFLGFADAQEFGFPISLPGSYFDNLGSVTAEFEIASESEPPADVPEPTATLGMLLLSAFGAGSMLKRKPHQKV